MCRKYLKVPTIAIVGLLTIIILVAIIGVTLSYRLNESHMVRLNEKPRMSPEEYMINQNNNNNNNNTNNSNKTSNNNNSNNNNSNIDNSSDLLYTSSIDNDNNYENDEQKLLYFENHPKNILRKEIRMKSIFTNTIGHNESNNFIIKNNISNNTENSNNNDNGNNDDGETVRIMKILRNYVDKNSTNSNTTSTDFYSNMMSTEKLHNQNTNANNINNNDHHANQHYRHHHIKHQNNNTINSTTVYNSKQLKFEINDHNPQMIDFEKRNYIKQMMVHAWENYKLYAWGKNELRPLSQRAHSGSIFGAYDLGATIVDGLDTLYLMGLEKEFEEGKDWLSRRFSLDNISAELSVFETNIRFVGGLLTLYAFTGDIMFKDKAQYVADKLLPAFQTPTGIPYALVNVKTGVSKNYGWASGGSSILSEFGTLHLEFSYLSDITGNPLYRERVQNIRQVLKEIEKPKGLYPNYLNPRTGKWGQLHMSLGALGDSFYEYLLKAWIQSGQADEEAREMFDDAMAAIIERMVRTSPGGLTYVSDLRFDRLEHKMDHLACFAGGLFSLAATTRQNQHSEKFMNVGKGLTNTCHESYVRTPTKLGPEAFRFTEAVEARALKTQEKYYILRPETFESYFILWRLTHDKKYRDWGWEAVQALEKHCRTPHGYCGLKNVYQEDPQKDDVQQSFFLAETLKYLYLLFSDDSLLPLDEWVFNTEAHPLPVKGANMYYRMAASSSSSP